MTDLFDLNYRTIMLKDAMKKTIADIINTDQPIVCLTSYTAPMTEALDPYCDLLLVGDSLAMVLYGEETTQKADLNMMIRHGKAVAKSAQNAVVIVDMPYGTYEQSPEQALETAKIIMKETGCDGVKLEGGEKFSFIIKTLTENNIPVMAHIGLLPQSVSTPDGYKVQGRDEVQAKQLMKDAMAVQHAGAFCVVVEAVPEPLAAAITVAVSIPTIGIGASSACDGQILVSEDMLGFSARKPPKFVKQYAHVKELIEGAIKNYAQEVKDRSFPDMQNTYKPLYKDDLKKAS